MRTCPAIAISPKIGQAGPGGAFGVISALIELAAFNADKQILRSTIDAKAALGLAFDAELRALNGLRYDGPTIVSAARVVGWQVLPMYDDQPVDFASFTVSASQTIWLAPQTLESARRRLQPQALLDFWYGQEGYRHPEDPDEWPGFGMRRLELLDNLGNVVAQAEIAFDGQVTWIDVAPMGEAEIAVTLQLAAKLEAEASEEARWDNFSSAESLREQAAGLRRSVSIVMNAERLAT